MNREQPNLSLFPGRAPRPKAAGFGTGPFLKLKVTLTSGNESGSEIGSWSMQNRSPVNESLDFVQTPVEHERANILLVDDKRANLMALEAILAPLKQNLVMVHSGAEALQALLKWDFAVILVDVNMPIMDGFETAALIRQRKNSEHTPIIFLSACSAAEMNIHKGYAVGAADYIVVPFVPEVLRTKVGVFVELFRKSEEIRQQSERLRQMEEQEHQRRLSEAAGLLASETRRNHFFNLSIDLLGFTSFDGTIRQFNPAWNAVLGFSNEQLQNSNFLDLVHPDDQGMTRAKLEGFQRGDTSASFENRYRTAEGEYRWLSWSAAPSLAEQLIYLFGRDVTERKRGEGQIQKLNAALGSRASELERANQDLEREVVVRKRAEEALKETNAELETFCYSVSHDLRAPLRAMQGFSEALLEDYGSQMGEAGRDFAQRIFSAANRMDTLIQDLLLYSRITHADLSLEGVNLQKALQEVGNQLEAPLREAHAVIEIEPPIFDLVGHHATLVQILSNLVSNAIKFVPTGAHPRVKIRLEGRETTARLWVEDNGIGIAPEFHARIFRVFERLHGVEVYPGTGIGLAIVRKGVERMGGAVGLESALGRGSRFWIELPIKSDNLKPAKRSS